jgi:hypothetical protein
MMSRTPRRLVVAMAAALGIAFIVPGYAHADPVTGVTCPVGSYALQFSPPVTTTPQTINADVTYQLSDCLSATQPGLTSATVNYQISRTDFTCLNVVDSFESGYSIDWNTGQVSTVSVTGISVAETTVVTGTVTSGLFSGETLTIVVQSLSATVLTACADGGLTSLTGVVALDLTA